MEFKDLAKSVAHAALDKTIDGKNIGEIAESALETVAEEVAGDLKTKELPATTDTTRGNIISSVVSVIAYFLRKLFR